MIVIVYVYKWANFLLDKWNKTYNWSDLFNKM